MNLTNTRPPPLTKTSKPSTEGAFFASWLVMPIFHTKLSAGRRARSASRTRSVASSGREYAEDEALEPEHRHDTAQPRPQRHHRADLPGALEDGHGHGIGDAEHDHDRADQREPGEDAAV